MKILIVLTYYRPHISGLTIYAERIARAFADRGHNVTILTSQFDRKLPLQEYIDSIRIVRAPVLFRLSKGVVMPTFGYLATKLVREHDVLQLHLPQFDAAGVALRGRLLKKPTIITYHCDLELPPGSFNYLANQAVLFMNHLAGIFTHRIVSYTDDYARHSHFTRKFLNKIRIIPPPVTLPRASEDEVRLFEVEHNPNKQRPVIGMAARFATEKGVEILLNAIPIVLEQYPQALFQFAGPYHKLIGEEAYFERLQPIISHFIETGNWSFLGSLNPEQMSAFYANLDVLVLPSLNSTESFGLVQIEAMLNGVPCVTSDLPGVRQPVLTHRMGRIFSIGDHIGLASGIIDVLRNGDDARKPSVDFSRYDPSQVAGAYEELFSEINKDLH